MKKLLVGERGSSSELSFNLGKTNLFCFASDFYENKFCLSEIKLETMHSWPVKDFIQLGLLHLETIYLGQNNIKFSIQIGKISSLHQKGKEAISFKVILRMILCRKFITKGGKGR